MPRGDSPKSYIMQMLIICAEWQRMGKNPNIDNIRMLFLTLTWTIRLDSSNLHAYYYRAEAKFQFRQLVSCEGQISKRHCHWLSRLAMTKLIVTLKYLAL